MAGSSSLGLETQLLDQFTCNICKSQLREPRALPCLHSFCEECLKGLCGDELFVQTITCPTCKQGVTVPGGNVSNFPVDFLADRFLSVVREICPDATGSGQDDTEQEKAKNYERCYGHDKIRDMYCHSCNQVYCTECSSDHVDHAVGTVKDAAMSAVQNMTSLTNAARDRLPPLQEAIELIRQSIDETEATHAAAKEGLDYSFDEMIRALKDRKKELLDELADLRYDRISVLKMKRNELCATIKRSLELSQTVTEVLEGDTDTSLIYKEEELSDALYRLCNKSYLIVTKEEDVKVDYQYKPKMLTKALEAITNVGEIEFHIDEESDEDDEDDEEEEILYDEEEMAREEIEKEEIEGEEVAKEDIYEEPHEEKSVREKKNVTEGGDVTDVQPEKVQPVEEELPSVSSHGEREKEKQEIPKEENQDKTQTNKQRSTVVKKNEEKSSGKQKESKKGDNEGQYREREEEAEHQDETRDTITLLDTPRTNTTTSLPRTRSERSGRRSGTTRDSNPCFEVKFSAPDNDTISRYRDISCTPIVELGGKGHEQGKLYYPYGVTITQQGNLLISDQGNSRIQVLDTKRGSAVMCFGDEGSNTGQFNGPSGVTTHEGQFYVSDTGNDRVQVFDQDGNFVRCIGEGKLHSPRGIAISGDYIYIANSGMGNISVFDRRTGQRVDKIHNKSPHSCDLQLPTGVTSDSNGYIFFTDANNFFCNHFIQVLTREHRYSHSIGVVGNKPGEFLGPSDLTTDSLGNVIITDTRNHRIQIVDKNNSLVACFGGFGRKKGLLHFPYGVCEQDGILYVSDTNNHRIQVFNSQTS